MKKARTARRPVAARLPPSGSPTLSAGRRIGGRNGHAETASQFGAPENLQSILSNSGIAVLVLDRELNLRFFTPAATSLFTVTAANLGRPLAEVGCSFTDDDLLLDARTVIATSVSLWREICTESGVWYNRRLLPYRTEDEDVHGVVVTFADVSEIKAAEREIETARAYSNSIIDTIHQSLVVFDHELRIVSASPSFYRSFAIKPEKAVGQQLSILGDRALDVQVIHDCLDRIAAGDEAVEGYEIEINLPRRGRRVLLLNARKIASVGPAKQRTLLAIDDITDRKHAEVALEAAKRRAERANLGKSRFLAAASHDLRQPLQTIALLQGILATKENDADTLRLAAKLGESLDVMSSMLNKLLDINQLEAGIVNPEPENFPINLVFERLRGDLIDQGMGKGLRCRVVSSSQFVRSDPTLLEQIIRNLISNAVKYTGHGKVLLGCRRRGDRIRIQVWDTGSGIPEEQRQAVFEEFHQLDNPARERARGLGLGLSIVQRLADLLGHTIDVRSRLGKGSVFSIEVPRVGAELGEQARTEPEKLAIPAGTGDTLLVVEDDPAIREMLQMLFEIEGYRVAVAADGKSALELIGSGKVRPNIVIADYNLPNGLSGLDVAARLRERLGGALPVLIVTGDISTDTLRAIAAANCVQLNKPIKAEELTCLVRSHLAVSRPSPVVSNAGELAPMVFLIDDDDALRAVICETIESEGWLVEGFASCEAFLAADRPERKGCLLVDAQLPGMGGLALLQRLKAEHRDLPSIMITGHGEVSMAVEAMKAGAIDFIEKPVSRDELIASIERGIELNRNSMALAGWREAAQTRIAGLTPRERQVMDLVIAGRPNKIIAADLNVSQRTVENHRAAVMKKTRSKSLSDLVRLTIAAA